MVMMTFERFEELTYELAQQLPEEFFRKLDGGVMAREGVVIHPAAKENDLAFLEEDGEAFIRAYTELGRRLADL